MTWLVFALISCMATCAAIEITRRSRLDPFEVQLYRSLISGFVLLPFVSYMNWPSDIKFYIMIGVTSMIYAWGNIVMSNLAAHKNGRVAMMFQPLMIFVTFLAWLVIDPHEIVTLQQDPRQMIITLCCFAVLMTSLHFIRRNDYAWKGLTAIAPVAIGFALLNVAQKWFMDGVGPENSIGTILAIIMIGNFGMVAVLPLLSKYRAPSHELRITHLPVFPIVPLAAIAVFHMLGWGTLLHAMQIAENPAYPVAILALAPVLFQIYYWIRGWQDNASPLAGAAMTLSAFLLGLIHM